MNLVLACYHHSLDAEIAHGLPFMHSWAVLFWLFLIVFGLPLAIEARARGGRAPMAMWLYVLGGLLTVPFTMGFIGQLFLILPFFFYRCGNVLGSGSGTRAFRAVTRATLIAMVVLVPVAYLRVRLQMGSNGFAYLGHSLPGMLTSGGIAVLAVLGFSWLGFFVGGRQAAREPQTTLGGLRAARARLRARGTQRVHRTPVAVQKHQACPLCWDLLVSPGREDELAHCPECSTTLHRDCADELGCCPTLACKRRAQRKAPRVLPSDRLLTITKRPRIVVPEIAGAAA